MSPLIPPKPGDKGPRYRNIWGIEFTCELRGACQPKNVNVFSHVMIQLMNKGYLCTCEDPRNTENIEYELKAALMNVTKLTGLMGRWQTVRERPTVICDTGHNPGAWEYLSKQLEEESQKCHELRIVFGMLEDKDVYTILQMLPKNARYYWTKGSTKRAFPETSLKVFGEQFGLYGDCYPTVQEAYSAAIEGAHSDDFIFVGGSTYIVADFLKTRAITNI